MPPEARARLSPAVYMPRLVLPASPALVSDTLESVREADVVHLHELWHPSELLGGVMSRTVGRPFVLSPHGALGPWVREQRRFTKGLAWAAIQGPIVDAASGIHTVTAQEDYEVRAAGIRVPTQVIPNGVDVGAIQGGVEDARASDSPEADPYILFLGRLDPKKGLDILLEAFQAISDRFPRVRLVLAGPDGAGMWEVLRTHAARLGVGARVSYRGLVDPEAKIRLLAYASLFALPSRSEGMSIALLEALAAGVPAVISSRCNVPEIEAEAAGRVVEPEPRQVAKALGDLLGDEALRVSMARGAVRLAQDRFSVDRMAAQMIEFYRRAIVASG